jgi:hypothetical protein
VRAAKTALRGDGILGGKTEYSHRSAALRRDNRERFEKSVTPGFGGMPAMVDLGTKRDGFRLIIDNRPTPVLAPDWAGGCEDTMSRGDANNRYSPRRWKSVPVAGARNHRMIVYPDTLVRKNGFPKEYEHHAH